MMIITGWHYYGSYLLQNTYRKDIETYGVIKLTQKGVDYIESPTSFMMTEDHSFKQANDDVVVLA